MKVSIEMNFPISAIELSVPIESPSDIVEHLRVDTQHCEIHGEHDFVLIPFLARYRAPIIDPEVQTEFTNLDEEDDFIDYCAMIGHCAVTFDEHGEIEHLAVDVQGILSETYSGDMKKIWECREEDDRLNVNCKLDEQDKEEIGEFVQDWLNENHAMKKAILTEYRKRGLKGKTPSSATKQ